MKALVAARDEPWISHYKEILERAEVEVTTVRSIKEAFSALEKDEYELVVTEATLSDGTGHQLAAHVKSLWPRVIVIYMTLSFKVDQRDFNAMIDRDSHQLESDMRTQLSRFFLGHMSMVPRRRSR